MDFNCKSEVVKTTENVNMLHLFLNLIYINNVAYSLKNSFESFNVVNFYTGSYIYIYIYHTNK